MIAFPDELSERMHLTSLRAERFAEVLPRMSGRCLDIGAGDNQLIQLYRERAAQDPLSSRSAELSLGVDVVDWGGSALKIESAATLPFENESFDTVCLVACLNHIPEREQALAEARRILRPDGQIIVTMIERLLGTVGHAVWWYSEDKHRSVDDREVMGMDCDEVRDLLLGAGLRDVRHSRFFYGLNHLFTARR